MSIRTTVTLDEDVVAALQETSKQRGLSFKVTLNEVIRIGLLQGKKRSLPPFRVKPLEMGPPLPGVNYDCSAELQAMEDEERYG